MIKSVVTQMSVFNEEFNLPGDDESITIDIADFGEGPYLKLSQKENKISVDIEELEEVLRVGKHMIENYKSTLNYDEVMGE